MGIKSLTAYLKNNFPEVFEPVHLSEYAYQKVAIDIALYMCIFKSKHGNEGLESNKWMASLIHMVYILRKNHIHPVFIYDSGAPPEKDRERARRQEQRDKRDERIAILSDAVERYEHEGVIEDVLTDFQKQKKIIVPLRLDGRKSKSINIEEIKKCVEKMKGYSFQITKADYANSRTILDILGVPHFNAPLEAETMCVDLCKKNEVAAVLSNDSDVLAYGSPVFLSKLVLQDEACFRLNQETLLEKMELTQEEFLDFCIMCGTDYNDNIFRVGPSKSYEYIKRYRTIEGIGENTNHDIDVLKHPRVRELFTEYEKSDVKVPYCKKPDLERLEAFLLTKGVFYPLDKMRRDTQKSNIIIEE